MRPRTEALAMDVRGYVRLLQESSITWYQDYLKIGIPRATDRVLDAGCGKGEFIASYCVVVLKKTIVRIQG